MAPPPANPTEAPPTPIPIKVLGVIAALMLAAVVYNGLGAGIKTGSHGTRGMVHEAAVPLQKRVRPSKFPHKVDPDMPDQVVVGGATPTATKAAAAAAVPTAAAIAAATPAVQAPKDASFAVAVDFEARASDAEMVTDELSCHAREGYDIAGDDAFVWGLSFNVASAAECCAACAAQRRTCSKPRSRGKPFWRATRRERTQARCGGKVQHCNAWVFCPGTPDGKGYEDRCFSYTIHNHTKGECWLKHEKNQSHPIAAGPTLPMRMRKAARKDWPWAVATNVWPWEVPEKIAWQAGIVAKRDAPVFQNTQKPDWHHKFCNKHGC